MRGQGQRSSCPGTCRDFSLVVWWYLLVVNRNRGLVVLLHATLTQRHDGLVGCLGYLLSSSTYKTGHVVPSSRVSPCGCASPYLDERWEGATRGWIHEHTGTVFRCGVVVYHTGSGMMSPGPLVRVARSCGLSVDLVGGAQPAKDAQGARRRACCVQ